MDSLDKRVRLFFSQCRRNEIQGSQADSEFVNVRKEHYKVLEDTDEKVQLANQMYDLVERYLRKLDSELHKFKCELEADNHGITDLLEKRSLELDTNTSTPNQKENRYFGAISQNLNRVVTEPSRYRPKPEKRRNSATLISVGAPPEKRQTIIAVSTPPTISQHQVLQPAPIQTVSYTGNAIIGAAAAQAIEKTQQMQQGRRTASLKASYEAIHGSGGSSNSHDLLIGRDLSNSHSLQVDRDVSFAAATAANQKRQKKKVTNTSALLSQSSSHSASSSTSLMHPSHSNDSDELPIINENGMVVEQTPDGEWTYDPNEPRYCICNQVSYGDMVACDNEDCPFEWFHYPCVNITSSPKGKWYCPQCTSNMRRRNRKN